MRISNHNISTDSLNWIFFPGLKGSLQRMQLEYVDVVFANRPDSNTPMEGEENQLSVFQLKFGRRLEELNEVHAGLISEHLNDGLTVTWPEGGSAVPGVQALLTSSSFHSSSHAGSHKVLWGKASVYAWVSGAGEMESDRSVWVGAVMRSVLRETANSL